MDADIPTYDLDRFTADTTDHKLVVLRDDGLYRHLRCKRPGNGFYWFELVTWPGHLTVVGGFGPGYTFARTEDMFTFFRARSGWNAGRINPQYWAEKIVSGRDGVQSYSTDLFRRLVEEHVAYAVEEDPDLAGTGGGRVGLAQAVEDALSDWYNHDYEENAREFLRDFKYEYAPRTADVPGDARIGNALAEALGMTSGAAATAVKPGAKTLEWWFTDAWEWDLTDWAWSYLWACHAIQWGIDAYDQATGGAVAAG